MKKFFTFLLCVLFVSALSAQDWTAEVQESDPDNVPVIGGDLDAAWDQADPHAITLIYQGEDGPETPTVGEEGDTYFKALWTDEGIYLLVYVADDNYVPYYDRVRQDTTGGAHLFDNVEVFLDCNYEKVDGKGGHTTPNDGHYQLAPGHNGDINTDEDWDNGTKYHNDVIGYDYAVNADQFAPAYFYEFYLPWTNIRDENGDLADLTAGLGFEVAVADNDAGTYDDRNRVVWSNNLNGDNDSWDNMDDCGLITFPGYEITYVAEIELTAEDITVDGDTVVIGVELTSTNPPQPPTDQKVIWEVMEGTTAKVIFDEATGTVIALTNGVFIVRAWDSYEIVSSEPLTINITNQNASVDKLSYIVDGYNNAPQENGRPNAAWERYGDHSVWVDNGVLQMNSDSMAGNPWDVQVLQFVDKDRILGNQEKEFVAKWQMWADEDTAFQLVLEQQAGWSYPHWGNNSATSTPDVITPNDGQTRWNLKATTEKTWYEISFIPDNLDPGASSVNFSFQIGHTGGVTIYMDSLYLIHAEDFDVIDWDYDPSVSVQTTLSETMLKVYPNPASNLLNVSLSGTDARTKVAIYNSVGIKMEEVEVFGNHHVFDVSNYSSGIYIVRAKDQFVKFVR